jgi:3-deoxy-7-phosphoheptulonate synthase
LQIGARNMQNYGLLQAVGKQSKPVLLKRGISGTIRELLMCAEYIVSNGNYNVMLCERGIRTYETATRNTFDLNAVPVLKEQTHLPVVADPSHGTGLRELVPAMSRAAIAAGADALILEVHPDPDAAVSDGRQSLTLEDFAALMKSLRRVAEAPAPHAVVRPVYQGRHGHPVRFSRACAAQLLALHGSKGAASIVQSHGAIELVVDDAGCVSDIDTLQDLQRTQQQLQGWAD